MYSYYSWTSDKKKQPIYIKITMPLRTRKGSTSCSSFFTLPLCFVSILLFLLFLPSQPRKHRCPTWSEKALLQKTTAKKKDWTHTDSNSHLHSSSAEWCSGGWGVESWVRRYLKFDVWKRKKKNRQQVFVQRYAEREEEMLTAAVCADWETRRGGQTDRQTNSSRHRG